MNKTGKSNTWIWLVLIVGVLYLFNTGAIQIPSVGSSVSTQSIQEISTCKSTTSPSLVFNAVDKYNPGTRIDNATMSYKVWIGGKTAAAPGQLSASVGSPVTLEVNKDYFIIGKNTSVYYAVTSGTAPCQNVLNSELKMSYMAAPTLTYFNADGQPSTVQAIGSSDEKTVKVKLEASSNKCFGNPQAKEVNPNAGIVVAFDYATANYTSVSVVGATKTDVPGIAIGTYEEAYILPDASICDLADKEYKVTLKAKSGVNPEGTSGNVTMRVYDPELFVNSDTGLPQAGVETEDDSDVGLSSTSTVVILVS